MTPWVLSAKEMDLPQLYACIPARLPEELIFYLVLQPSLRDKIYARQWKRAGERQGYVTRFASRGFLDRRTRSRRRLEGRIEIGLPRICLPSPCSCR